MIEEKIKGVNTWRAWLLAARPKTLTGAAVPVMIGVALAYAHCGGLRVVPALLCLAFALIMQIDANLVNDYFDWRRGNDDEERLGPKRACAEGWVTPNAMMKAIAVVTAMACAVGLPLVAFGGWQLVAVGALCVVFCFLYTTTLSYLGLGDVLVLVFFGFIPVVLTYWLSLTNGGMIGWDVWMAALGCGLAIDTLLVVNNYRDIDGDRKAGKRTLIVWIGERNARVLYLLLGFTAWALMFIVLLQHLPVWICFISIIYLILHYQTFTQLRTLKGRALNKVLGMTARNIFIYGLIFSLLLVCFLAL